MAIVHDARRAVGGPGIAPRWTRSRKDAIGTAYSAGSTVRFTVSAGVLNEAYYPTIDRPQIRDLQYLVTDGKSFFHDERRHLDSNLEDLENGALGVRITNTEREGRYRIVKAPKILRKLQDGTFVNAFCDKGRFTEWLQRIPVSVVLDPTTALRGAAAYLARIGGEGQEGERA